MTLKVSQIKARGIAPGMERQAGNPEARYIINAHTCLRGIHCKIKKRIKGALIEFEQETIG